MDYLELRPAASLSPFIRALWYANAPAMPHKRERILPSGCVEVILNLARDYLIDCHEGQADYVNGPALVVGARSVYEIVDTGDMESLIGIHFQPGGFAPFVRSRADELTNQNAPLDDLFGPSVCGLRDALREIAAPQARLKFLHGYLLGRLGHLGPRNGLADFALDRFQRDARAGAAREVAKSAGCSERRLSQVFREQVGFPPKVWCRIQRFQKAVLQLHAGADLRWAELALDCGFYDQSHFANEFRAFSGIDATTYVAQRTRFSNHIAVE